MGFRIALIFSTLLVAACAKDTQNPEAGASVSLAIGQSDCLKGTADKIQRFFAATGSEAEISSVWTCVSKVLKDFGQYTRGSSPNGYTGAEIQGFLGKYYFEGGLSEEVINSTLTLKRVIAGGDANFLTHSELNDLIQLLGVLNSITHDVFPYTKILFTKAHTSASEADWFRAHEALDQVADRVAQVFAGPGQEYQFASLQSLLQSWATQMDLPADHIVVKAKDLVSVLAKGKALLIAGTNTQMRPDEWQPLLATLSKGYSYFRMLDRMGSGEEKLAILGSTRLPTLVEGVIGLLDQGVQRRSDKKIPVAEIKEFLVGLKNLDYFPASITAEGAASAIQFLPNKLFAGGQAAPNAVTATTVSEMRKFLTAWKNYDTNGSAEFNNATRPGGASLVFDNDGRLVLPSAGSGTFHELSLIFTTIEWLGQQWGTWPLNQTKFNPIVADCLTILHNLDLLTDFQATVANRLMRESNLFVPSGNGDLILDKAEAFQYAVFALSGYRGSKELELAAASCAGAAPCISALLFEKRNQLLSSFPALLAWLNNDAARWNTFSTNVGLVVGADKWLMQFVVMHYIETYMMRFDANKDQFIDFNESMVGFPVYQPVLGIILPEHGLGAGDVKPMYTFLFRHGTTPDKMSGGKTTYVVWKLFPSSWVYTSDRNILAGILASLADMTK